MKIMLFGHGKMGKMIAQLAERRDHHLVSSLEDADVCIDFSVAKAVIDHVDQACKAAKPIVIGTTGWEVDLPLVQKRIEKSGNAGLYAPNFSLGVALFQALLKKAQALFSDYDIAGSEWHHRHKQDTPSGTARAIAANLEMATPFSSIRCGSIVGKHEVIFDSPEDTIKVIHEAKNREGFASGAVKAAEWIRNQKGWFTLDDMLYSVDHTL